MTRSFNLEKIDHELPVILICPNYQILENRHRLLNLTLEKDKWKVDLIIKPKDYSYPYSYSLMKEEFAVKAKILFIRHLRCEIEKNINQSDIIYIQSLMKIFK